MTAGGHWRTRWAFGVAIGIALALAWLQGSPAAGEAAGTASGGATASRAKTVDIVDFAFKPANLTVSRGTRVVWSNTSGTTHTVTGAAFDKRAKGGRSVAVTFERRGTFAYHCKIHPFMKGKVVVQ